MARRPTPRPAAAPPRSPRELLFGTWFGRLFIVAIGLAIAVAVFAWRLFVQIKRRLLWRVRRKLILSYIFIGVIPSLLILVFFLFAGSLVFMNVSAYLFKDGYDTIVEDSRLSAQAAATEIARTPAAAAE